MKTLMTVGFAVLLSSVVGCAEVGEDSAAIDVQLDTTTAAGHVKVFDGRTGTLVLSTTDDDGTALTYELENVIVSSFTAAGAGGDPKEATQLLLTVRGRDAASLRRAASQSAKGVVKDSDRPRERGITISTANLVFTENRDGSLSFVVDVAVVR